MDTHVEAMRIEKDYLLHMNVFSCLIWYMDGGVSLDIILQLGERLYSRNPKSLSNQLRYAAIKLHELKEENERGEQSNDLMVRLSIVEILGNLI